MYSFVHVFVSVVDFGVWFAVFRRCVSVQRGFVLGPFYGVEDVFVLVSPVVSVGGGCIVLGGSRGIPFVAPVLVTVPPM